jgi:hypothetical protein
MQLRDVVGTGCGKDDVPQDHPNEIVHESRYVMIGKETYKLMEDATDNRLHCCTPYSVET